MHITPVQNYSFTLRKQQKNNPSFCSFKLFIDTFEKVWKEKEAQRKAEQEEKGPLLDRIINFIKEPEVPYNIKPISYESPTEFAQNISNGLKEVTKINIPPQNFKNIMSPEEFKELLPELKQENFTYSERNEERGVYFVDLDYQSNFSNRNNPNVYDILDKLAEYSDEYYKNAGKDFIFALSDRDSIEGLQHLVRFIGEEPEKYQHLKFIPAIKLTFAHPAPTSKIGYENSEMLVYGINPFSKNLINFVDNIIQKRRTMVLEFIRKVNKLYPEFSYNILEFAEQNKLKYYRDYTISNLYWRAREYAETKGDLEIKSIKMVPEKIVAEAETILNQLSSLHTGSTEEFSALGTQIIDEDSDLNKKIKEVFHEYSTHMDEDKGKVVSYAENLYNDMIDCLDKEPQKPVLAIASPYYLSHYFEERYPKTFDNVVEFINKIQKESKGMLCAFESVVPAYGIDRHLSSEQIRRFNNYIREHTDLYEVGGSFDTVKLKPKPEEK